MAIQINGGLLSAMARPAWGRNLSEGIKGMLAESEQAKMLKPLMESTEQFQQGVETGDARLAGQAAQNLIETGKAQGNIEMYQKGIKMRQAVPQVALAGNLKGINAIEKALSSESMVPEARAALEQRLEVLKSQEGVGAALMKQQEAKYDFLNKQDRAQQQQHAQLVNAAENAIIAGRPEEEIIAKVGASAYKDALAGANDFSEEVKRARELKQTTKEFSKEDPRYVALPPVAKAAVDGAMNTNGHTAALNTLDKQYQTVITNEYQQDKEKRTADQAADVASVVASVFEVSNTDAWFDKNKDIGQWYGDLEPKEQEKVREVAEAEAKRLRMEMGPGGDLVERRQALKGAVQNSIEDLYNRSQDKSETQTSLREGAPTVRGIRSRNTTSARRARGEANARADANQNFLENLSPERLNEMLKQAAENAGIMEE